MNKNNKKGFTLAELLIVVAIIGVLVAVSIPIFTAQLEKSREATDMANVRSAYADLVANYLVGSNDGAEASTTVKARQLQSSWQGPEGTLVTRQNGSETTITYDAVTSPNSYTISIDASGSVTVTGN